MVFLCKQMLRTKVKGTRFKAASSPEQEPDFFAMAPVVPCQSDNDKFNGSVAAEIYSSQPMFNFEPLQYVTLHQAQQALTQCYQPPPQVPYSVADASGTAPPDADFVFDEAVDELFFNEEADEDTLNKFCSEWDPSFDDSFEFALNNDLQLGFMLEKLLEE
jgi:hypothetical protein